MILKSKSNTDTTSKASLFPLKSDEQDSPDENAFDMTGNTVEAMALKKESLDENEGAKFDLSGEASDRFALKDDDPQNVFDGAEFDITEGKIDRFELKKGVPEQASPLTGFDMAGEKFERFELKGTSAVNEADKDSYDILSGRVDRFEIKSSAESENNAGGIELSGGGLSEAFPLKSTKEDDNRRFIGQVGEFVGEKTPIRKSASFDAGKTVTRVAAILSCVLVLVLVWVVGGTLYTKNLNERMYKRFSEGEDITSINPDFHAFIACEGSGTPLPVVKSEKPLYTTAFNSLPMPPGTLTSTVQGANISVTGSSRLLKDFISSQNGERITFETPDKSLVYEVFEYHECDNRFSDIEDEGILTIYKKDKDKILALHARLVK